MWTIEAVVERKNRSPSPPAASSSSVTGVVGNLPAQSQPKQPAETTRARSQSASSQSQAGAPSTTASHHRTASVSSGKPKDLPPAPSQGSSFWSFLAPPPPKTKPVKMKPTTLTFLESPGSSLLPCPSAVPLYPHSFSVVDLGSSEESKTCGRCLVAFSAQQPPTICGLCHKWYCTACTPFKITPPTPATTNTRTDTGSSSVPSIRVCHKCYAFQS